MTTVKKEIENAQVMTNNLSEDITDLINTHKSKLTEEAFESVKGDDCEMRSKGICMYDETATELLLLIIRSADINWECLVEKLNSHDIEYVQDAIKQSKIKS